MKRRLRAYDTSGRSIKEITPGGHSHLRTLVYDPMLDALWVADKQGQVRRYDPETGRLQFKAQVAGQPVLPLREYRPALAPDGEGGLWIAVHKHLIKLNAAGGEIFRLTPFAGEAKQPIVTLGMVALKAVAHKLARACYYILRDQVPFQLEKAFG